MIAFAVFTILELKNLTCDNMSMNVKAAKLNSKVHHHLATIIKSISHRFSDKNYAIRFFIRLFYVSNPHYLIMMSKYNPIQRIIDGKQIYIVRLLLQCTSQPTGIFVNRFKCLWIV